eukprot:TRINITY_DN1173_c0_g1_i1.p1 TRINITY_DN1173_c0_g1~~TRINITY_DN1173_c0_g1_i1.p1  ORF type:complete len:523 (+),score=218.44 TRINITY_DN1173_c0_g1_i1:87-1571(+)
MAALNASAPAAEPTGLYQFEYFQIMTLEIFLGAVLTFYGGCSVLTILARKVCPGGGARKAFLALPQTRQFLLVQRAFGSLLHLAFGVLLGATLFDRFWDSRTFQTQLVHHAVLQFIVPYQTGVLLVRFLNRPVDSPTIVLAHDVVKCIATWLLLSIVHHQCRECSECDLHDAASDSLLAIAFIAASLDNLANSAIDAGALIYGLAHPTAVLPVLTALCSLAGGFTAFLWIALIGAYARHAPAMSPVLQGVFFPWALAMLFVHGFNMHTFKLLVSRTALKAAAANPTIDAEDYSPTFAKPGSKEHTALRDQASAALDGLASPRCSAAAQVNAARGSKGLAQQADQSRLPTRQLEQMSRRALAEFAESQGVPAAIVANMDRADLVRALGRHVSASAADAQIAGFELEQLPVGLRSRPRRVHIMDPEEAGLSPQGGVSAGVHEPVANGDEALYQTAQESDDEEEHQAAPPVPVKDGEEVPSAPSFAPGSPDRLIGSP